MLTRGGTAMSVNIEGGVGGRVPPRSPAQQSAR